MYNYKISVNQLATFAKKSERGKTSIVRQQQQPKKAVVSLYGKAKKLVSVTLINSGNKQLLQDGINELKNSIADTEWKLRNKTGSIAALEKFAKASIPHILHDNIFESIKPSRKHKLIVSEVEIIVSPDIILKTIIHGVAYFGAIKIHISKNNVFDREEAKYVTTCLYQYLSDHYGNQGQILPELCLCVDVYAGYIKYAPSETKHAMLKISEMCEEIKNIWIKSAA